MCLCPQAGCIPAQDTQSIGGSWSALTSAGEATNLNLAHVMEVRPHIVNWQLTSSRHRI